jgi:endoglucanase
MSHKVNTEILKQLCETPGVSGYEDPIRNLIMDLLQPYVDRIMVDSLGNVVAYKKRRPNKKRIKIMIAAHMDEIGFVVKYIDKEGFLRLEPVGGIDARTVIGQKVIVYGKKPIVGVLPPRPIWLTTEEERKKVPEVKEMFVDLGLPYAEVVQIVRIGDPVVLAQGFAALNENVVVGRNFDDRIGIYVMWATLTSLKSCGADIYAVATVQEELGVRGAGVAAFNIEPNIGIAIDGSLAADVPGVKEEERGCSLGKGVGIYLIDRLTVSDKRLVGFLMQLAEKNGIPYQLNIGGGTDASAIQRSKGGTIVCTIGPPIRYMHSGVQLCHLGDIEAAVDLLCLFLESAHAINWLKLR